MKNKIQILGQDYQIVICSQDDMNTLNPRKKPSENALNAWGLCDHERKIIFIDSELTDKDSVAQFNRVLRHEIIHALVYESGINGESYWGQNEECVDFYAIQMPKLIKLFKSLNISDK